MIKVTISQTYHGNDDHSTAILCKYVDNRICNMKMKCLENVLAFNLRQLTARHLKQLKNPKNLSFIMLKDVIIYLHSNFYSAIPFWVIKSDCNLTLC